MVEGLDKLSRKLTRTIPEKLHKALHAELERQAQKIVATAKAFAPVKSGDLRDSIDYTFGYYITDNANVRGVQASTASKADPDLSVTIHAGDERAFYAAWVEFGTKSHNTAKGGGTVKGKKQSLAAGSKPHPGAAPHPFFFPAYRQRKKAAKAAIARVMRKAIKDGSA